MSPCYFGTGELCSYVKATSDGTPSSEACPSVCANFLNQRDLYYPTGEPCASIPAYRLEDPPFGLHDDDLGLDCSERVADTWTISYATGYPCAFPMWGM